jgi:ferrous iron transport protein A
MISIFSLDTLPLGAFGRIKKLTSTGISRRRMMDLGMIPGTIIEALMKSPAGDPIAYEIRGTVIALRKEESRYILIELFE